MLCRSSVLLLCALGVPAALAAPPKARRTQFVIPVWPQSAESAALTPENLTAKIDGAPVQVRSLHGPSDDLLLLVVTDFTSEPALVDSARQGLASGIEGLPVKTHAGLMRAQDGLKVLLDPTADREALATAIQQVPVSGNAGLLETVETVARIADAILTNSDVRVAVLYVTDSNVYNYREDFTNPVINWSDPHDMSRQFPEGLVKEKISKLESVLAGLQAPIFVLHLSYRSDRLNEAYQTGLMQLAAATGGSAAFCRSRGEIPQSIGKMLQTIGSHYAVGLELPGHASRLAQIQLESPVGALTYRTRFRLERK